MSKLKKVIACLMAMVVCFGASTNVFAANIDIWGKFPTQNRNTNDKNYTRAVQRVVASFHSAPYNIIMNNGGMDGSFGQKTKEAVIVFQEMYNEWSFAADPNLSVDGSCGPKTWRALYDSMEFDGMSYDDEFFVWTGNYTVDGHEHIIRKGNPSGRWGARPVGVTSDSNSVSWYVFHTP